MPSTYVDAYHTMPAAWTTSKGNAARLVGLGCRFAPNMRRFGLG